MTLDELDQARELSASLRSLRKTRSLWAENDGDLSVEAHMWAGSFDRTRRGITIPAALVLACFKAEETRLVAELRKLGVEVE